MYLYEDYQDGSVAQAPNGNGTTANRLSVIEITSILSVTISASILIFHIWKATHEQQQSASLARRSY